MKRLFSNTWFVSIAVIVCLSAGIICGYLLEQAPTEVQCGISYGFVAFAMFPIGLCTFGVKELNSSFLGMAPYLDSIHRKRLGKAIDKRIQVVIVMAFAIILIQVIGAFYLLYFATQYEKVILGVLFGGIISSLIYGLFVCFSVRGIAEKTEEILSDKIGKERISDYKKRFQGLP